MLIYPRAGGRVFRFCMVGTLGLLAFGTPHFAQAQDAADKSAVRLGYHFKAGETYRYRVTGFFDGHIPPFAQTGGPPVHLRITLDYAAHVDKQAEDNDAISFTVENAGVILLDEAVGADEKMPPADKQIDFPIPLDQIQTALNVKATLKPDGTIIKVNGGDANSQKINLGVELRKLFLLLLPVAFPQNAVKTGDTWRFDDGLLGKNTGKTNYTASLTSLKPGKRETIFTCHETADTVFDERLDKAGKPVVALVDAVDTSDGKASLTGDFTFSVPTKPDAKTNRNDGRLQSGRFVLTATLHRKRTIPDPANPDAPLETNIDVTARLNVQPINKK